MKFRILMINFTSMMWKKKRIEFFSDQQFRMSYNTGFTAWHACCTFHREYYNNIHFTVRRQNDTILYIYIFFHYSHDRFNIIIWSIHYVRMFITERARILYIYIHTICAIFICSIHTFHDKKKIVLIHII